MARTIALAALVAVGIALVFAAGILVGARSDTETPRFSMHLDQQEPLTGFRLDRVTGDVVMFGLAWDPPVIVVDGDEATPVTRSRHPAPIFQVE